MIIFLNPKISFIAFWREESVNVLSEVFSISINNDKSPKPSTLTLNFHLSVRLLVEETLYVKASKEKKQTM